MSVRDVVKSNCISNTSSKIMGRSFKTVLLSATTVVEALISVHFKNILRSANAFSCKNVHFLNKVVWQVRRARGAVLNLESQEY
jgi:hypothetical protein